MTQRLVKLASHAAFVLAGLVMLTWPWTFGAHPRVECRGVEMAPGDVCHKAELDGTDKGKTQTYEDRLAAKKSANPIVAGMGLAVTGFATYLLVGDLGRRDEAGDEL